MPKASTISTAELEILDRFYRDGGLRAMASPHVHYDEPALPMRAAPITWIGSTSSLSFTPIRRVDTSPWSEWWDGTGFVGRCPACREWIRFTTLKMEAVDDGPGAEYPHLPDNWTSLAQFA